MSRAVVLSDIQAPLHDGKLIDSITKFLGDYQPDALYCVGDEADLTEVSRWVKGGPDEYTGKLQAGLDATAQIMADLRDAVGDVPIVVQRSNHTDRLANYVRRYAPALECLRGLDYASLLRYRDLNITVSDRPTAVAPGWIMLHGDEAGSNQTAGGTALGLARRTGRSVVCGHTHKLGLQHDHAAHSGRVIRGLWGMEVGHMMNLGKASYLPLGGANWQQGFGLLHIDGARVIPTPVPVIGRAFTVEGEVYSW